MSPVMSHKFRLATADTWPNPWPMYRALRDHDPVHHVVPEGSPVNVSAPATPVVDHALLAKHADRFGHPRLIAELAGQIH